jgi:hypothetical protein
MAGMLQVKTLILVLALTALSGMCGRAKTDVSVRTVSGARQSAAATFAATPAKVDFNAQVRPLLESRCTPCHFTGGTMYERLPFDRPETIKQLGTKLFTRLKDENDQRVIRDFLSQ